MNGVTIPKWAWGICLVTIPVLLIGFAGWMTWMSATIVSNGQDIREVKTSLRYIERQLEGR